MVGELGKQQALLFPGQRVGFAAAHPLVQARNQRHRVQPGPFVLVPPLPRRQVQHPDHPLQGDVHRPGRHPILIQSLPHECRQGFIVNVRERHLANERVQLLQAARRQIDGRLVPVLQQVACRCLPPDPHSPDPVDLLLPERFQPVDQVLFRFGPVTSASALVKSFSVDPLVDVPDTIPLREARDPFSRHLVDSLALAAP
ncbi:hypothetical protein D9M69_503780 [compost metagenome]